MYRIKNLFILLVLISLVFSCDLLFQNNDDSINYTMDENYAGDWYADYVDPNGDDPDYEGIIYDGVSIYSFTDTSLSISICFNFGFQVEVGRGTINKISETTMEYQVTHEWDPPKDPNGKLKEVNRQARVVNYSVSEDGTTLTFDGETYSSIDPRE